MCLIDSMIKAIDETKRRRAGNDVDGKWSDAHGN
jgi:hypothetical protein